MNKLYKYPYRISILFIRYFCIVFKYKDNVIIAFLLIVWSKWKNISSASANREDKMIGRKENAKLLVPFGSDYEKVKEQFWSRISAGLGSALAKWPTAFCLAPEFTPGDSFARRYRNPKLLLAPFSDIHCVGNCFKSGSS